MAILFCEEMIMIVAGSKQRHTETRGAYPTINKRVVIHVLSFLPVVVFAHLAPIHNAH